MVPSPFLECAPWLFEHATTSNGLKMREPQPHQRGRQCGTHPTCLPSCSKRVSTISPDVRVGLGLPSSSSYSNLILRKRPMRLSCSPTRTSFHVSVLIALRVLAATSARGKDMSHHAGGGGEGGRGLSTRSSSGRVRRDGGQPNASDEISRKVAERREKVQRPKVGGQSGTLTYCRPPRR